MGKIRIKTIGDEALEAKQKEITKKKKEAKLASKTHLPGMEGGQRIAVVSPTEEELEKLASQGLALEPQSEQTQQTKSPQSKPKKSKFRKARSRSSNYAAKLMEIHKDKTYSLSEALDLLKKVNLAKFDETVELHINTIEPGISGQVKLPHGTGKEIRIAIADPSASSGQVDELLNKIEAGKLDFDILIATPAAMPKLARVAKFLGPRGLMPNPKNGTISDKPEEAMKKFQGGQISFKTESKVPVMHLTVGKMSFGNDKLSENIRTLIDAIKKDRITKVTLKSTMSPGIRLTV